MPGIVGKNNELLGNSVQEQHGEQDKEGAFRRILKNAQQKSHRNCSGIPAGSDCYLGSSVSDR
jgi:hypothetical protein